MNELAAQVIDRDRGLGTAYERYHFYRLVERWAAEYGVKTALEGPLDGMAGVSGVHLAGLARRGVQVTSALPNEPKAALARAVYRTAGGGVAADVRVVADPMRAAEELAPADLVIAYHALPLAPAWRAYLRLLAGLARKVLVVTVCNPDNWGVAAIRAVARLRGLGAREIDAPETWRCEILAPELWGVGRVREHTYFDAPWWPDLQVAPGQSLRDRARQLLRQPAGELRFTAAGKGARLAERFVYGPGRWPYFGDDGWSDELEPALRRHPSFERASAAVARRAAHLHAFVVDRRPRTPQARRRLAVVGTTA